MEDILGSIEQENLTSTQRGETYETLRKVLSNIVANPAEQKFRTLKKDNKLVSEKLIRSSGAISTLLALGFEDGGAAYVCPPGLDLAPLSEVVDLLECIIASRGEEAAPAAPGASATAAVPAAVAATAGVAAAAARIAPATGSPTNHTGFARRDDVEKERQEQSGQLEAVRAAQRAQFTDGGGAAGALRAAAPEAPAQVAAASADAKKKPPIKSSFDFESREKKETQQQKAADSLEDLRRAQKEKFKDFQSDPTARQAAAYQQPPSVAPGGKADQSWGDWLGGMFGGSSSGGGGGGGGGSRPSDDRKPKLKTINDLPKPVQRG